MQYNMPGGGGLKIGVVVVSNRFGLLLAQVKQFARLAHLAAHTYLDAVQHAGGGGGDSPGDAAEKESGCQQIVWPAAGAAVKQATRHAYKLLEGTHLLGCSALCTPRPPTHTHARTPPTNSPPVGTSLLRWAPVPG